MRYCVHLPSSDFYCEYENALNVETLKKGIAKIMKCLSTNLHLLSEHGAFLKDSHLTKDCIIYPVKRKQKNLVQLSFLFEKNGKLETFSETVEANNQFSLLQEKIKINTRFNVAHTFVRKGSTISFNDNSNQAHLSDEDRILIVNTAISHTKRVLTPQELEAVFVEHCRMNQKDCSRCLKFLLSEFRNDNQDNRSNFQGNCPESDGKECLFHPENYMQMDCRKEFCKRVSGICLYCHSEFEKFYGGDLKNSFLRKRNGSTLQERVLCFEDEFPALGNSKTSSSNFNNKIILSDVVKVSEFSTSSHIPTKTNSKLKATRKESHVEENFKILILNNEKFLNFQEIAGYKLCLLLNNPLHYVKRKLMEKQFLVLDKSEDYSCDNRNMPTIINIVFDEQSNIVKSVIDIIFDLVNLQENCGIYLYLNGTTNLLIEELELLKDAYLSLISLHIITSVSDNIILPVINSNNNLNQANNRIENNNKNKNLLPQVKSHIGEKPQNLRKKIEFIAKGGEGQYFEKKAHHFPNGKEIEFLKVVIGLYNVPDEPIGDLYKSDSGRPICYIVCGIPDNSDELRGTWRDIRNDTYLVNILHANVFPQITVHRKELKLENQKFIYIYEVELETNHGYARYFTKIYNPKKRNRIVRIGARNYSENSKEISGYPQTWERVLKRFQPKYSERQAKEAFTNLLKDRFVSQSECVKVLITNAPSTKSTDQLDESQCTRLLEFLAKLNWNIVLDTCYFRTVQERELFAHLPLLLKLKAIHPNTSYKPISDVYQMLSIDRTEQNAEILKNALVINGNQPLYISLLGKYQEMVDFEDFGEYTKKIIEILSNIPKNTSINILMVVQTSNYHDYLYSLCESIQNNFKSLTASQRYISVNAVFLHHVLEHQFYNEKIGELNFRCTITNPPIADCIQEVLSKDCVDLDTRINISGYDRVFPEDLYSLMKSICGMEVFHLASTKEVGPFFRQLRLDFLAGKREIPISLINLQVLHGLKSFIYLECYHNFITVLETVKDVNTYEWQQFYTIKSTPNSGATTLGRQILYYFHEIRPCAYINCEKFPNSKIPVNEISEVFAKVHKFEATKKFWILVVDNCAHKGDLELLYNALNRGDNEEGQMCYKVVVIGILLFNNQIKIQFDRLRESEKNFGRSISAYDPKKKTLFIGDLLNEKEQRDLEEIEKEVLIDIRSTERKTFVLWGMLAFKRENLQEYLENHFTNICTYQESQQYVFIAGFIRKFCSQLCFPKFLRRLILKKPVEEINRMFSNSQVFDVLVQGTVGPCLGTIAEQILLYYPKFLGIQTDSKVISSDTIREFAEIILDYIKKYINNGSDINSRDNEDVVTLLRTLFIKKDKEIVENEENNRPSNSSQYYSPLLCYLMDSRNQDTAISLFKKYIEELTSVSSATPLPIIPLLRAHYAKILHFHENGCSLEKIRELMQKSLKEAESIPNNDMNITIHTIFGYILSRELLRLSIKEPLNSNISNVLNTYQKNGKMFKGPEIKILDEHIGKFMPIYMDAYGHFIDGQYYSGYYNSYAILGRVKLMTGLFRVIEEQFGLNSRIDEKTHILVEKYLVRTQLKKIQNLLPDALLSLNFLEKLICNEKIQYDDSCDSSAAQSEDLRYVQKFRVHVLSKFRDYFISSSFPEDCKAYLELTEELDKKIDSEESLNIFEQLNKKFGQNLRYNISKLYKCIMQYDFYSTNLFRALIYLLLLTQSETLYGNRVNAIREEFTLEKFIDILKKWEKIIEKDPFPVWLLNCVSISLKLRERAINRNDIHGREMLDEINNLENIKVKRNHDKFAFYICPESFYGIIPVIRKVNTKITSKSLGLVPLLAEKNSGRVKLRNYGVSFPLHSQKLDTIIEGQFIQGYLKAHPLVSDKLFYEYVPNDILNDISIIHENVEEIVIIDTTKDYYPLPNEASRKNFGDSNKKKSNNKNSNNNINKIDNNINNNNNNNDNNNNNNNNNNKNDNKNKNIISINNNMKKKKKKKEELPQTILFLNDEPINLYFSKSPLNCFSLFRESFE